jgi:hypothetical protein
MCGSSAPVQLSTAALKFKSEVTDELLWIRLIASPKVQRLTGSNLYPADFRRKTLSVISSSIFDFCSRSMPKSLRSVGNRHKSFGALAAKQLRGSRQRAGLSVRSSTSKSFCRDLSMTVIDSISLAFFRRFATIASPLQEPVNRRAPFPAYIGLTTKLGNSFFLR